MADIEIKRGYEVLPDNNVRFRIGATNNSDSVMRKTTFARGGAESVNIKWSVVQHNEIKEGAEGVAGAEDLLTYYAKNIHIGTGGKVGELRKHRFRSLSQHGFLGI